MEPDALRSYSWRTDLASLLWSTVCAGAGPPLFGWSEALERPAHSCHDRGRESLGSSVQLQARGELPAVALIRCVQSVEGFRSSIGSYSITVPEFVRAVMNSSSRP